MTADLLVLWMAEQLKEWAQTQRAAGPLVYVMPKPLDDRVELYVWLLLRLLFRPSSLISLAPLSIFSVLCRKMPGTRLIETGRSVP